MFEVGSKPFRAWRTPEDANEHLTDQSAIKKLIEAEIDDVQNQKQARLVEDCGD